MERGEVAKQAWRLLEPELNRQGFELVELEYVAQGSSMVLRVYLDREGGITLDQCAAASQVLSPLLDAEAFMDGRYILEVSSPGIARPIRKAEDFRRFRGEKIKIVASTPVLGRARFTGTLMAFQDGLITIECDGEPYEIHVENLKKAHLDR